MIKQTIMDRAIDAANHHTDLNVFAMIVAILEGGTVYTRSGQSAVDKVIALCKDEQVKQVKLYDKKLRSL